ncbi:DNA cytosine methyltransferase [Xanthomonas campestris pv. nigromaculans]|nr:DNA cytosine methyltransferase [Xanthomonas hortorum]ETC90391.1 DNA cytosine methyltransferase [Xanthomonas hortorum pv. carotae str. M081]MCC4625619.1 DNA cytosine methyltransferase [Xanthomonas campestris pv. nigromaculans]
MSFKSIELFTGAGGLALATHSAGFHHVGLFEWNRDACETLRHNAARKAIPQLANWQKCVHEGDVSMADFTAYEGMDLVAGGPPCQPFSLGGKHGGMEDNRDMIPQFIRAVREAQPRAFIMENVRGLTRQSFATYLNFSVLQLSYPEIMRKRGEAWEQHLARLQQHHTSSPRRSGLSYNVVQRVLNAADYGVPQCRERIFLVGFRCDVDAHWSFPEATHSQEALLHDQWVSGDYWRRVDAKRPTEVPNAVTRRWKSLQERPATAPWRTIREAVDGLPKPTKSDVPIGDIYNHRLQSGARPYPGHTGSLFDAPSKTLKAGDHGVPGGENMIAFPDGSYRYLTIREAARVQTFPDTWRFEGVWSEAMRQLGNAVPVNLAAAVAKSVANTLKQQGVKKRGA